MRLLDFADFILIVVPFFHIGSVPNCYISQLEGTVTHKHLGSRNLGILGESWACTFVINPYERLIRANLNRKQLIHHNPLKVSK